MKARRVKKLFLLFTLLLAAELLNTQCMMEKQFDLLRIAR